MFSGAIDIKNNASSIVLAYIMGCYGIFQNLSGCISWTLNVFFVQEIANSSRIASRVLIVRLI
jgi:hypothetical protein